MSPDPQQLAITLTQLAAAVLREKTLAGDLSRLTRLTMKLIEPAAAISVALLVDGHTTTAAASDRVAIELDLVQNAEDEGPCLLALDGRSVRVALLATGERFPHFAIGAADQRIKSVLSVPILSDGDMIGTMDIYSQHPDAFDDEHDAMTIIANGRRKSNQGIQVAHRRNNRFGIVSKSSSTTTQSSTVRTAC